MLLNSTSRWLSFVSPPLAVPFNRGAGLENKEQLTHVYTHTHTHTHTDIHMHAPSCFSPYFPHPPAKHTVKHLFRGITCVGSAGPRHFHSHAHAPTAENHMGLDISSSGQWSIYREMGRGCLRLSSLGKRFWAGDLSAGCFLVCQEQHPGGSEGCRIGQRGSLGGNAVAAMASANPIGSSGAGTTLQRCHLPR